MAAHRMSTPVRTAEPPPARAAWIGPNTYWMCSIGFLLLSRAISMAVGVVTAHHRHYPLWSVPGYHSNSPQVTAGTGGYFTSWDSFWYVNAAQHGWPHHYNPHIPNTTGFFPGLPLLLRGAHWLTGNWVVAGVLTEGLIEVAAVVIVALLAREVLGWELGLYATLLFCLFPGAYVFSLVYSEPLYILGAALCLYGLARRWWWVAGAGASVAGVTRSTGLVLVVCCCFVAAREVRLRRDWSATVAAAGSVVGIAAVSLFFWVHSGSPLAYQKTQATAWKQSFKLTAVADYVRGWLNPHFRVGYETPNSPTWVLPVFILLGAIALCLVGWLVARRGWPSEWLVYSVGAFGVTLLTNDVGFRPRMALTAIPLIFAVAWFTRGRLGRLVAISTSVIGLIYFSASIPRFIP